LAVCVLPAFLWGQINPYSDKLLARVRTAAQAAPGERPRSLHLLTFAEVQGTRLGAVEGTDSSRVTIAFAVFQIRFTRKWIMVDAGFDRALWDQFSPDRPVRYRQDHYEQVQRALREADDIVLTHEHWDHAGGVERGTHLDQVAANTRLTGVQLRTLLDRPDSAHYVRLDHQSQSKYRAIEYDLVYRLAPGVVLISAPGHTPGAQLIYVRLGSGRELLLVGDLVWLKEGLETGRQRPEATSQDLKEDRQKVQQEIDWVRRIVRHDGITAIPSHDKRVFDSLTKRGVLQEGLALTREASRSGK
jgi:glyoxylase-like metal-dependent hydrolase (beta-lactamase superfamily II)